jgi:hypothetical protein
MAVWPDSGYTWIKEKGVNDSKFGDTPSATYKSIMAAERYSYLWIFG